MGRPQLIKTWRVTIGLWKNLYRALIFDLANISIFYPSSSMLWCPEPSASDLVSCSSKIETGYSLKRALLSLKHNEGHPMKLHSFECDILFHVANLIWIWSFNQDAILLYLFNSDYNFTNIIVVRLNFNIKKYEHRTIYPQLWSMEGFEIQIRRFAIYEIDCIKFRHGVSLNGYF